MADRLYIFQEPNMLAYFKRELPRRTKIPFAVSYDFKKARNDISTGFFNKIIVDPYVTYKQGYKFDQPELLMNAVIQSDDVLAYTTLTKDQLEYHHGLVNNLHFNHHILMPANNIDEILKALKIPIQTMKFH